MRHRLDRVASDGAIATLAAGGVFADAGGRAVTVRYRTRTGALLRIDGAVRGAFDREHEQFDVAAPPSATLSLEVERRSLPGTGLPPGDGLRWRMLVARAAQPPARSLEAMPAPAAREQDSVDPDLAIVGHSHLDLAWLWTYEEAVRKGQRTLATALRQMETAPAFVFTQTQPQLFALLAERDPTFFEDVRAAARSGRLDTSGAAMWVEADCLVPSGESLLRQLVLGIRYVEREFGRTPSVAFLPDSFGFPNTLPALLAHAGIRAFATTKLGWNDTTTFPYPRFRWQSPDGSTVLAAMIASIEGGFEPVRIARARARGDLLLIGHGDGGGGARDGDVNAAAESCWTSLGDWFESWNADAAALPVVCDELYLEQHRGTATTHHDVKTRNAALERALGEAEAALAWAYALHATPFFLAEAQRQLERAWSLVLRAQFHDVLPGTSIAAAYADVHGDYDEAATLVAGVTANARSVLPVARPQPPPALVAPRAVDGEFVFENAALGARIAPDGALVDLRVRGGPNLVRRANRLARYVDRPRRWDAWNVDRSYRRRERPVAATGCEIADDALEARYAFGRSAAVARFTLAAHEPFLRVAWAIRWDERHTLLRIENDTAFAATRARFGSPHGAVDRAPDPRSAAERAKYEACGQRFARLDGDSGGVAMLALDSYGWSLTQSLRGSALGHSLLRAPTWPDPGADRGTHEFSLAYLPFVALGTGELETRWTAFAGQGGVPMFTSDDPAVVVVATKLADDGDGVIVRARECDGAARPGALRCAARARAVVCVDALERPVDRTAELEDGAIRAPFGAFELRSFRVRLA